MIIFSYAYFRALILALRTLAQISKIPSMLPVATYLGLLPPHAFCGFTLFRLALDR